MRKIAAQALPFRSISIFPEPGASARGLAKLAALLLLLATLAAVSFQTADAQSRPRRVTDSESSAAPAQPSTSPSRPPVLGGANANGQSPTTQNRRPSQDGPEEVSAGDVVRVNTTLVTIPVSVMDRDGKYIPNLRKEDFQIWDDGVAQQVAYFASVEQPFTVALVIDTSGSTHFKIGEMQDAAIAFVDQLRSNDRVMVVSFDDKIRMAEPTSDREAVRRDILRTKTGGGTRLYDAVDQVMTKLSHIQGRKAIVLFTDGVDTTSRSKTYESTVQDAEELDGLIYPVQFDTYSDIGGGRSYPGSRRGGSQRGPDILGQILGGIIIGGGRGGGWPGGTGGGGRSPGTSPGDYRRASEYLHDLADKTGARVYDADQDLSRAFAQVAEELRRQYSLGYYPKSPGQPGERHQIRVRANRADLVVRARDSYIYQSRSNATAQQNSTPQSSPVLRKTPFIYQR